MRRGSGSALGVGLLGLGRHGRRYAEHLARGDIREARLVAVWRRDRAAGRRDAAQYGVALAPTPIALCERRDVDIVAVVLPPGLYPPIVEAAARAGKAILLEKPLAATPAAARRILRAVRQARVPAMVAHTLRFDSRVRALVREVRKLGPVRTLLYVHHLPNRGLRWESEATHGPGGILHQTATHGLDLIRFITGREARRVSCLAWRVCNPRVPDAALIRVELAGGVTAALSMGKFTAGLSHAIEAVCDGGIVRADLVTGRLTVSRGGGGSTTRRSRQREWVVPAAPTIPLVLGAFARAIRAGGGGPAGAVRGRGTHARAGRGGAHLGA